MRLVWTDFHVNVAIDLQRTIADSARVVAHGSRPSTGESARAGWDTAGMVASGHAMRLVGRQRELAVLERLLDGARDGHGAVLVVLGDPGVGKTVLLASAVDSAPGLSPDPGRRGKGDEELDYAALQQLCSPILELGDRLPDPQREALEVAFGRSAGHAPSPFLVGLAVLNLLSDAAEQQPLFCVVDDAQWLDNASARALAFVARRLLAERIVFVFATRDADPALARFPRLQVDPLGRRDARALLESVLATRLDDPVLERIVAETGGNPLAILELPRGLTPAQLAGGFALPAALPLSTGIEQSFRRRLEQLPPDARRLLLLAAAEPLGDAACCGGRPSSWAFRRRPWSSSNPRAWCRSTGR